METTLMAHDVPSEKISGQLQQLLFSPRGTLEGLLLDVDSRCVQVSMDSAPVEAGSLAEAVGKEVALKARPDRSHKTKQGSHPVYKLDAIEKIAGRSVVKTSPNQPISGVVAAIHYAKHGEPNGVILESGEFIHTRPPGMKKLALEVGSKVTCSGEVRTTVLGTRLIEARKVNGLALE